MSRRRNLLETVLPAFIVFALWLDGWFYPLILLPLLYVKLVDKKGLGWIGFHSERFDYSILLGVCSFLAVALVWFLFFAYYLPLPEVHITPYVIFTDVAWYPFYEEVTYRGFALAYFAPQGISSFSLRNLSANFAQALLFVCIHHKYITMGAPLFLIVVLLLGLTSGFIFLKTRNIFGCFLLHSLLNSVALLIRL